MILRMIDSNGNTKYIINLDRFNDFYVENSVRVNGEPTVVGWFPNGGVEKYQTENIWSFKNMEAALNFLNFMADSYAEGKKCIDFYKDNSTYKAH